MNKKETHLVCVSFFRSTGEAENYSTVTDLAKLRGWSISQPRRRAM